jgi:RNA polymerase sigma-70 factor (ECF subfamily)
VKVDALPDPELEYLRRKYRVDFEAAFAAAVADLAPRERSLLRQHLVERLSGEDLARLHGVDSGTISRRLGRAREHVAEQTCSRLRATLDISAAELDSILVVIRSRLDLSITRVFAEAG